MTTNVIATLTYLGPSLAVLHENYAKRHRVDEDAPIQGRGEVVIAASVERVWRLLSDVVSWGDNLEPGVHDIHLDGGVSVDARFSRTNKGARMKAQFAVVDPHRELAWTGSAFGAKVVHRFTLRQLPDDATRVVVEESMAGPLLAFFFSTAKLNALIETTLATLASAAEAAG